MTKILGIVNVTRDSFSDGGRYLESAAAIDHARRLLADGADIIDLGAESTHPDAENVSAEVEIARLTPVIVALKADGAMLSVDSCKPAVMRHVLSLGVDFINDVTALETPGAVDAVRESDAKLILLHAIRAGPASRPPPEWQPGAAPVHFPVEAGIDGRAVRRDVSADRIVATVIEYFERRIAALVSAGIARERLIVDPGMGFFLSANAEPSLAVLRDLRSLQSLGCPLLICTSRKSFIGTLLGTPAVPRPVADRGAGTLTSELWAAAQGVAYIRTHDVRALRDGLRVWSAIQAAGTDFPFG
jgi:dihydropteroate synthase type 2